uniref:Reverse transcriptase domain-containing protein n=1 Tax=Micrurus lemniscatus lemniscatus TaxID=129467 RepID=A0A2D4HCV7_MICLE
MALHVALDHLEHSGSYVSILFVDYSSAFNTIIPDILIKKLLEMGLSSHICCWINDFLTNRPQTVRIGSYFSSTLALSTGSPQGCVLNPLLYSLYTYDCTSSCAANYNKICRRHHVGGTHIRRRDGL